jgi:hypothetical protein
MAKNIPPSNFQIVSQFLASGSLENRRPARPDCPNRDRNAPETGARIFDRVSLRAVLSSVIVRPPDIEHPPYLLQGKSNHLCHQSMAETDTSSHHDSAGESQTRHKKHHHKSHKPNELSQRMKRHFKHPEHHKHTSKRVPKHEYDSDLSDDERQVRFKFY